MLQRYAIIKKPDEEPEVHPDPEGEWAAVRDLPAWSAMAPQASVKRVLFHHPSKKSMGIVTRGSFLAYTVRWRNQGDSSPIYWTDFDQLTEDLPGIVT